MFIPLLEDKLRKSQLAAYKAWATRREKNQDHSPLDLEMDPVDRAVRDAVREIKGEKGGCIR